MHCWQQVLDQPGFNGQSCNKLKLLDQKIKPQTPGTTGRAFRQEALSKKVFGSFSGAGDFLSLWLVHLCTVRCAVRGEVLCCHPPWLTHAQGSSSSELRAQGRQHRSSALLLSNKSSLAWQERIQLSSEVIHLHMSSRLPSEPSLQSSSCSRS